MIDELQRKTVILQFDNLFKYICLRVIFSISVCVCVLFVDSEAKLGERSREPMMTFFDGWLVSIFVYYRGYSMRAMGCRERLHVEWAADTNRYRYIVLYIKMCLRFLGIRANCEK